MGTLAEYTPAQHYRDAAKSFQLINQIEETKADDATAVAATSALAQCALAHAALGLLRLEIERQGLYEV